MQDTMSDRPPTRLEVGVACAVSVPLGVAAIFVLGMATLVLVPGAGVVTLIGIAVVLDVAAVGGGWLIARGGVPAKGFGAGVVAGWGLLALWSGGISAGAGILS